MFFIMDVRAMSRMNAVPNPSKEGRRNLGLYIQASSLSLHTVSFALSYTRCFNLISGLSVKLLVLTLYFQIVIFFLMACTYF